MRNLRRPSCDYHHSGAGFQAMAPPGFCNRGKQGGYIFYAKTESLARWRADFHIDTCRLALLIIHRFRRPLDACLSIPVIPKLWPVGHFWPAAYTRWPAKIFGRAYFMFTILVFSTATHIVEVEDSLALLSEVAPQTSLDIAWKPLL